MKVVPVVLEDVKELQALAKASLLKDVAASDEEKAFLLPHILSDVETYIQSEDCLYLKLVGDKILAYILIRESWNLTHLFVDPNSTGQGLGKTLLMQAIELIKSGENKGYLSLNSSSNAVPFYKRMGFVVDQSRKPKSESSTPMILTLNTGMTC